MNHDLLRDSPKNLDILLKRAQRLGGLSIQTLADNIGWPVPQRLNSHKGWIGDLLECHLGASAGSAPLPDFPHLGIELKTIPLNGEGKPRESTFVSTVPMDQLVGMKWEESEVSMKLRCILWIPIIVPQTTLPIGERTIGSPFLWYPTEQQWQVLKEDWQTLTDAIVLGKIGEITAREGTYLQIRPKGADSKQRRWGIGKEGEPVRIIPHGFYLRATFTHSILQSVFFSYT